MTFAAAGPSIERKGLTRWDFGHLPATLAVPARLAPMASNEALNTPMDLRMGRSLADPGRQAKPRDRMRPILAVCGRR